MKLMDDGLGESHCRVIGSGMLIVDSAAIRILDLLDKRNSPIQKGLTQTKRSWLMSRTLLEFATM
jgi:hypothetical protein